MKRWIALLLCLVMIPVAALAGEKEVWARIDELMPQQVGYTPDMYEHGNLVGDPDNGWSFSITLYDHPEDNDGLLCYKLTPEGELVYERGPYPVTLNQRCSVAIRESLIPGGYMKLAETVQVWREKMADVNIPTPEEAGYIWDEYILMLDIRFPEEGAISYEEAVAAAEAALLSQPGWTEETLTHFTQDYCAYMVPADIGRPVWLFFYDKYIPSSDSFRNHDEWTKAMIAAYERTILGKEEPVHFSVLIDAMDGSLVEPPAFDYRAPQFLWSDFIARPETFLNYYHTEE